MREEISVQRHALIYLKEDSRNLFETGIKEQAILSEWLCKGDPLICTRQPEGIDSTVLQVGIACYDKETAKKERHTYQFKKSDVRQIANLPLLSQIFPEHSLPSAFEVGVYGAFLWQYLTKRNYVHAGSDLDILIAYSGQTIQELASFLKQLQAELKIGKIDGEIRFAAFGDCAIAELCDVHATSILFKSTQRLFLMDRIRLYEEYPTLIS